MFDTAKRPRIKHFASLSCKYKLGMYQLTIFVNDEIASIYRWTRMGLVMRRHKSTQNWDRNFCRERTHRTQKTE